MELLKEMKILLDAVRKHAIDLVAKGGNNELAIIVNENLQNPLQVTVLFPFVSRICFQFCFAVQRISGSGFVQAHASVRLRRYPAQPDATGA